jgi:hypothetical protein
MFFEGEVNGKWHTNECNPEMDYREPAQERSLYSATIARILLEISPSRLVSA